MKNQKFISVSTLFVITLLITSTITIASFNKSKSNILKDNEIDKIDIQLVSNDVSANRLSIYSEKIREPSNNDPTNPNQSPLPLGIPLDDWWNYNWHYRKKININSLNVIDDLVDFPILINLFSDNDLKNNTQSDGDDIVFTDVAGNKLAHEIEYYNETNGNLVAWVRIPFLSSSVDTILYLYYGNPDVSNQEDVSGTWNDNYIIVQHLEETSGKHYDSTKYSNDGDWLDLNGQGNQNVQGIIDGANQFDGIDDFIDCGNDASLNVTEALTIEVFIRYSGGKYRSRIIDKYPATSIYINASTNKLGWYGSINGSSIDFEFQYTIIPRNIWTHIAVTYANDSLHEIKSYINGIKNMSIIDYSGSLDTTIADLLIGNSFTKDNAFNGTIDEFRISNIAFNESWINTEYDNLYNPNAFYSIGEQATIGNTNITGLEGNEKHPAIATDSSGNILAAYDYDNKSSIIWTVSTDQGETWETKLSTIIYNIRGFEQKPSIEYWGSAKRFFGTFVTPPENYSGGMLYLLKCNDLTDPDEYELWDYNFQDDGWYNMTDSDIACDSSQNNWEFGMISLISSTTYPSHSVTNGPHLSYADPIYSDTVWIEWISELPNCAHTKIDIDRISHSAYAVYDWFNDSSWELLIWVKDFVEPTTGYNEIFILKDIANLTCPSVAASNDNLIILAETDVNGNKDIVCYYSNNGINKGNLNSSFVVNSTEDESYPEITYVTEKTFICTYVKNGNLFTTKTLDGGATWSTPKQINDVEGSVVNEYKTACLNEKTPKVMWEDNRGNDIDIYFEDLTEKIIPPINSRIKGYVKDTENNYLSGATITVYNHSFNWKVSTKTDDNGYYELGVFGGWFNITAAKNDYFSKSRDIFVKENDTQHWENFSLIKFTSSLRIGPISGGFGVNAIIENIGDGSAYDVEWTIHLDGGLVLKNRRIASGTISQIQPHTVEPIDNRGKGLFLGFGQIIITVIVKLPGGSNITKKSTAFLMGFLVTLMDVPLPLRKKVSGHITDNDTGKPIRLAKVIVKPLGGFFGRRTRTRILFKRAGFYKFKLLPGDYQITVKRFDYLPQTKIISVGSYPITEDFSLIRK